MQKQLEEKDKQLAVKDKQIEDLSNRLAEALQLTKGQQYIAAADKTKELIEADTVRKEPQETAKEIDGSLKMQESDQKKEGKLSKFLGWFRNR